MAEEKLNAYETAIKSYLDDLAENDEFLKTLYNPSKIKECFAYVKEQARKQAVDGCAMVQDAEVYKWARDYYIEVLPKAGIKKEVVEIKQKADTKKDDDVIITESGKKLKQMSLFDF